MPLLALIFLPVLQVDTPSGDQTRDAIRLLLLVAGIAILSFGAIFLLGLWYLRGRDPHAPELPGSGGRPPTDLPAGVVGSLLDERVDHHDIVATLFDLQRRGVISLTHAGERRGRRDDFTVTLLQPDAPLEPFEEPLIVALFGRKPEAGATARLSERSREIAAEIDDIRRGLYEALVRRGYFLRSPDSVRQRWRTAGQVIAALSVVLFVVIYALFDWTAIFPAAPMLGIGLAIMRLSNVMPAKTRAGAEEAARWRAFQADLTSIAKMGDAAPALAAMERYLPYALALGVSSVWVDRFAGAMPVESWAHAVRDRVSEIDPSLPDSGWGDALDVGGDVLVHAPRSLSSLSSLPNIDIGSIDLPSMPSVGAPSIGDLGAVSGAAGEGVQGASDFVMGLLSAAPDAGQGLDAASNLAGSVPDLLSSVDVGAVGDFMGSMADAAPNALDAVGGILEVVDAAEVLELAGSVLGVLLEGLGDLDF
jgi:hypothetical protein